MPGRGRVFEKCGIWCEDSGHRNAFAATGHFLVKLQQPYIYCDKYPPRRRSPIFHRGNSSPSCARAGEELPLSRTTRVRLGAAA